MRTKGVLILECMDKSDPGSEGRFLRHMFNLMEVDHQYVEVRTRYQLIALMKKSPYKVIHITTHGSVARRKKQSFKGLWFKDGIFGISETKELEGKLQKCSVVCTACMAGDNICASEFVRITKCDNYIAPSGSPRFHNSIFFAHILYHKHFIFGRGLSEVISEYDDTYKNPHGFALLSIEDFIDKTFRLASERLV
ncbi:MAG: hypothetical protein ABSF90_29125 [Syntrophobacteraceae bacterium]|jgi:hypothetical protein